MSLSPEPPGRCRACAHFRGEPSQIEQAFPGLASLGSAYGSVRAEDGLCLRHDRYLGADCWCADFAPRATEETRGPAQA